jgi:hypothetical protein
MASFDPAPWFTELAQPLLSRFGHDLSLAREGECVRWSHADDTAVVELGSGGAIEARFIGHPVPDAASRAMVRPVYMSCGRNYPLTRPGVARMVDDLAEFFSGTREPRFTFVDAYVVESGPA